MRQKIQEQSESAGEETAQSLEYIGVQIDMQVEVSMYKLYYALKLKGDILSGETDLGIMIWAQIHQKPCEWVP